MFCFSLVMGSFLSACVGARVSSENAVPYSTEIFTPINFMEHTEAKPMQSYLAMNVVFPPVEQIRWELEKRLNLSLRHRGEAHMTLVTPPEYDQILKRNLSIEKIHEIAREQQIQRLSFEPLCIARASANLDGRGEQAYYIVVKSPGAKELRQRIRDEFVKAGGDAKAFDPEAFWPHITLGFTKRDLHAEDGISKDERSCFLPLVRSGP